MKAKKIVMVISILLFVIGFSAAYVLFSTSGINPELRELLINISIGIGTGGLIAALIETPMIYSSYKSNKTLLWSSLYANRTVLSFIKIIDDYSNNNKEITSGIFKYPINKIVEFAKPLIYLEPNMFCCRAKQKQIGHFLFYVNDYILISDALDNKLNMKITEITKAFFEEKIRQMEAGTHTSVYSSSVIDELKEMKIQLIKFNEVINTTMGLVLTKKEYRAWYEQANSGVIFS